MESLILYLGFTLFLSINSWALKNNKRVLIVSSVVFISLFYGLRIGIGNDYAQYENIYNQINISDYTAIEPTFILLSKLFYNVNDGFNVVVAIYTFLTFLFCYIGLKKYNIYNYIPVLLFSTGFVFFVDNQIRQGLATAFFIYYSRYITSKEFGKYVLCVAISTVFVHFSSAILLLAYFVPRKNISRAAWFVLLVVSFGLMKFDVISTILVKLISFVPYYSELYLQRFNAMLVEPTGSGLGILFWIVIAFFILIYSREIDEPVLVNLFMIGMVVNTIFINYDIFERISFYFIYLRFILLALIIKRIMWRNNVDFILCLLIIILTLVFTSFEVLTDSNKHGSAPLNLLYYKVGL